MAGRPACPIVRTAVDRWDRRQHWKGTAPGDCARCCRGSRAYTPCVSARPRTMYDEVPCHRAGTTASGARFRPAPASSFVCWPRPPPSSLTRDNPLTWSVLNRIVPFWLQAPPRPWPGPMSASARGAPPPRSTILSLPPAKKPTRRLSGAQNGKLASSVPASTVASLASSRRTHSCVGDPGRAAAKTIRAPSGEIIGHAAAVSPNVENSVSAGGWMSNWIVSLGAVRACVLCTARPEPGQQPRCPSRPRCSQVRWRRGATAFSAVPRAIQRSSVATSAADCHRASGSFASAVLTTWSRAGRRQRLGRRDRRRVVLEDRRRRCWPASLPVERALCPSTIS